MIEDLSPVDIDQMGRFKYIQVKAMDTNTQRTKIIVRGFQWADYHQDIVDNFRTILDTINMTHIQFAILGGGRIYREPNSKVIKISGVSEAYGRADHALSARMIKDFYPDYTVSWSDEENVYHLVE